MTHRAHHRKFLFSGLLICDTCGGGYTVIAQNRYGCASRRSKGTCDNSRTIKRQIIEDRTLSSLREHLLVPEMVEVFVKEFQAEINRLADLHDDRRRQSERALAEAKRKIGSILSAIEDGLYSPSMKERLADMDPRGFH